MQYFVDVIHRFAIAVLLTLFRALYAYNLTGKAFFHVPMKNGIPTPSLSLLESSCFLTRLLLKSAGAPAGCQAWFPSLRSRQEQVNYLSCPQGICGREWVGGQQDCKQQKLHRNKQIYKLWGACWKEQGLLTENKGTCWDRIISEASPEEQP